MKKITLVDEFKYYLANREEFVKKYEGKYLVIKNKKLLRHYNTEREAVMETMKNHKLGTFLVRYVDSDDESLKPAIISRVVEYGNAE